MGNSVADVAVALEKHGADVAGSNCGDLTPQDMAELVLMFRDATDMPLLVQPNAGMPVLKDGITTYNMSPDDFADGVIQCLENGANIVGGCCGTTLEHMKALIEKVRA